MARSIRTLRIAAHFYAPKLSWRICSQSAQIAMTLGRKVDWVSWHSENWKRHYARHAWLTPHTVLKCFEWHVHGVWKSACSFGWAESDARCTTMVWTLFSLAIRNVFKSFAHGLPHWCRPCWMDWYGGQGKQRKAGTTEGTVWNSSVAVTKKNPASAFNPKRIITCLNTAAITLMFGIA